MYTSTHIPEMYRSIHVYWCIQRFNIYTDLLAQHGILTHPMPKRLCSKQHLIKNHACRPHVDFGRDFGRRRAHLETSGECILECQLESEFYQKSKSTVRLNSECSSKLTFAIFDNDEPIWNHLLQSSVAVSCNVFQCDVVCCSVLQCLAATPPSENIWK